MSNIKPESHRKDTAELQDYQFLSFPHSICNERVSSERFTRIVDFAKFWGGGRKTDVILLYDAKLDPIQNMQVPI